MNVQSKVDVGTTISVKLPLDLDKVVPKPSPVVTTLMPKSKEQSEQRIKRSA
jgi:hypothetical protein